MKQPKADKPLAGVRVLVGRARHQASALSKELRERGATVIEIPFIEIRKPRSFRPLDAALKNIQSYDWLILTSVNGVEAMWERMKALRLKPGDWGRLRVAAIGPATKKAMEEHTATVDVVPKEYVAESVVRSLRPYVKAKRVVLVRAKIARDVIPRELRKAGARVDVVEAYETVVPRASRQKLQTLLTNPRRCPHIVTFTSSSTVRNFVQLLESSSETANKLRSRGVKDRSTQLIQFASIGPVTSSTLREFGLRPHIQAREYTIPGLVQSIVDSISGNKQVQIRSI